MKNTQQGFTLIELMIVVAIIGILAAIAIPQYQNFIARSQVTEAVNLLGGAKTAIEEKVSQDGAFPAAGTTSLTDLGIKTTSKYVASVSSSGDSTDEVGNITATMNSTGVAKSIASGTVSMYRAAGGNWTCTRGATGTTLEDKFLPRVCRNAAL
ncbi:MAG: pilin [Gammaproteobacteria bacterium]|nr:pilin [Gammaproteobacteria bacterium]